MAAIDGAARLRALAAFLAAQPCPLLLGMRMIDALATDVFGRLPDGWDAALRRPGGTLVPTVSLLSGIARRKNFTGRLAAQLQP